MSSTTASPSSSSSSSSSSSPSSTPPLSLRDQRCHRLFSLLIRFYYPIDYWIISDALLSIHARQSSQSFSSQQLKHFFSSNGQRGDNGQIIFLTDQTVANALRLPVNKVKPLMGRLRVDGLLKSYIHEDEAATQRVTITDKMRKRGIDQRVVGKKESIYYIDWYYLVKVIKYKQYEIHRILSQEKDESLIVYHCPTGNCPGNKEYKNIMDLLGEGNKDFRCTYCKTKNASSGTFEGTKLVEKTEKSNNNTSNNSNNNPSSSSTDPSSNSDDLSLPSNRHKLKELFNKHITPIMEAIQIVEKTLDEEVINSMNFDDENDPSNEESGGGNFLSDGQLNVDVTFNQKNQKGNENNEKKNPLSGGNSATPWMEGIGKSTNVVQSSASSSSSTSDFELRMSTAMADIRQAESHSPIMSSSSFPSSSSSSSSSVSIPMFTINGQSVSAIALTQEELESLTEEEFDQYEQWASQQNMEADDE